MWLAAVTRAEFDGFHGISAFVLVAAIAALGSWVLLFISRWFATRPRMPDAGPETNEPGAESPAVVNLLVNRWKLTRSAIQATLLDLAARQQLGVEEYAGGHVVVRLREASTGSQLTPYERQVVDVVRRGASGGSAPVEALSLGEPGAAERWWKDFDRAVVKEARTAGLARSRWAREDWLLLGGTLFVAIELLALSFSIAHLAEDAKSSGSSDGFGRWDWLGIGLGVWFAGMVAFGALRDLRDTKAGQAACARWLGVRDYLRNSHTFDDVGPGAVAIWERYIAYGVATGVAHDAMAGLPLGDDDPNEAWTRYTGDWRRIRVEYPERFGFGEAPVTVFLGGLVRFVFWGTLGGIVLNFALPILFDIIDAISGPGDYEMRLLVLAVLLIPAGWTIYITARAVGGFIRLVRGFSDLGRTVALEGEVVKVHMGRVAIDDGRRDEVVAWTPPPGSPGLARGMKVRVVHSPHLYHVTQVTVLSGGSERTNP